MYYYDQQGWLTSQPIEGRSTDVAPPQETETLKANWTGVEWVLVEYTAPPAPPAPAEAVWAWFIDIGPFYDRFGAAKMAVLTSADSGVKAIMSDVSIRKWIDLKRADVASSLAYIGTKVPAVDATLQSAIINTPVADAENLALRKLYFA
jgi:hypothetical protein